MSKKPKAKNTTQKAKKKNLINLTLKQKDFISNYTDIDNKTTYSNGTQSVMKAYGYDNTNMSAVHANNLLSNSKVKSEVERILDELNLDTKVRLKAIKSIIEGKDTQETTTITQKLDNQGNAIGDTYKATTTKAPRASDKLKAIDLLGKIDGTYDKNKAKADVVSNELKAIFRQQRRELQGKGRGKDTPT